ncbi:hypothetical protein B0H11DRAFT_1920639 [Mycena galericulata]|nr:hypothetical protein B0H11DRAFT_1920639 [Mycena galericulata]
MSSESTIITVLDGYRFTNTWVLVAFVILCYDHLLTLDSEIKFLWRRPKRLSFFLFILLRYFSLFSNIAMTRTLLNFDYVAPEMSSRGDREEDILGLRVYAMYGFSKIVLFFLCSAAVVTVILAAVHGFFLWSSTSETTLSVPDMPGCQYAISKPRLLQRHPVGRFLCDVVVFGFTVFRSYRQPDKIDGSILGYMVRDGALYFAVLALVNLVNILMYYVRPFLSLSASLLSCAAGFQFGNPIRHNGLTLDAQLAQGYGCRHSHR